MWFSRKHYPGVQSTMYYGFPAYSVARKVFVFFVSPRYEVLRLPRRRVKLLAERGVGTVFGTARGMWHEWLVLDLLDGDYLFGSYGMYFDDAYLFALGRKLSEFAYYYDDLDY